jgi:hypothetical protein
MAYAAQQRQQAHDIWVESHQRAWLLRPLTDKGRRWMDQHVMPSVMWRGHPLFPDRWHIFELIRAMQRDGLAVEVARQNKDDRK